MNGKQKSLETISPVSNGASLVWSSNDLPAMESLLKHHLRSRRLEHHQNVTMANYSIAYLSTALLHDKSRKIHSKLPNNDVPLEQFRVNQHTLPIRIQLPPSETLPSLNHPSLPTTTVPPLNIICLEILRMYVQQSRIEPLVIPI